MNKLKYILFFVSILILATAYAANYKPSKPKSQVIIYIIGSSGACMAKTCVTENTGMACAGGVDLYIDSHCVNRYVGVALYQF